MEKKKEPVKSAFEIAANKKINISKAKTVDKLIQPGDYSFAPCNIILGSNSRN